METKHFKINLSILNTYIDVFYGKTIEKTFKLAEKKLGIINDDDLIGVKAYCSHHKKINPSKETSEDIVCIYIAKNVKDEYIYHESLHAAWFILDSACINITADNHEILAYTQGHIAREIKKKIA
jgi:hypothetical protein